MKASYLVFGMALLTANRGLAQAPNAACSPKVHLVFQVEKSVRPVADSAPGPRLTGTAERRPENLVQFVVDTTGSAEMASFQVLRAADSSLVRQLREQLPARRFVPAEIKSCRVRQMYQTGVAPVRGQ